MRSTSTLNCAGCPSTHTGDAAVESKAGQAVHSTHGGDMKIHNAISKETALATQMSLYAWPASVICGLEIKKCLSLFSVRGASSCDDVAGRQKSAASGAAAAVCINLKYVRRGRHYITSYLAAAASNNMAI